MGGTKPFIPIGATYLFGLKNNKSFLEAGLGILLAEKSMWNEKLADDSAYLSLQACFHSFNWLQASHQLWLDVALQLYAGHC